MKMNIKTKIALCSGADFWHTRAYPEHGIRSLTLSDGPHGLRKQETSGGTDMLGINDSVPATSFPTASLTACSFAPELAERIGKAIGEEAASLGVDIVLGPGANLKRNPLCGRNFEYFSEDPLLSGRMAAGWIRGAESTGVSSCLKHFACNNRENSRFSSDSLVDERTLRELYLSSFETAITEGHPSAVMSAYNKLNGVYCSDNKKLLTDILRNEWGFDGLVITDWGGLSDRIAAFRAGCDLSMPGSRFTEASAVIKAVKKGTLAEEDIDKAVARIRSLASSSADTVKGSAFDREKHNKLAKEAAEESAVLLKNDGNVLPLAPDGKAVFIGAMAKNMRYQGSGSSHINPIKLTSPLEAMPDVRWVEGCCDDGSTCDGLLCEAVRAAASADVAVIFAGLPETYESEGFDRDSMKMPEGQLRLIDAVAAAAEKTVVVLFSGSAVECPWADNVDAILYMGLPGQAGGEALRDLLYGYISPSGKLAESWPYVYEDCASSETFSNPGNSVYAEGIYVGYRYYEKASVPVRFPFGHGLSYTSFEYSGLRADGMKVSVSIKNTGSSAGAESVLLMSRAPGDGIVRPIRELRGFEKVKLAPGESKTVTFSLSERSFAVWQNGWKIPAGTYYAEAGPLSCEMHIAGEKLSPHPDLKGTFYESCLGKPSAADFEKIYGKISEPPRPVKGFYTMNNSVEEMKDGSLIMKILYRAVESTLAKGLGVKKGSSDPSFRMMMNASLGAPLRCMQISSGVKPGIFSGLLAIANGHPLRGILKMIF
ncbi:MAG: glycoside hydrolase family 3 C-terminal domain-containing protein [Clostridia bacterium]|nr:glycoside hydrolase family 3 C-terminal domain-containing protein [Clostridia bacterium]